MMNEQLTIQLFLQKKFLEFKMVNKHFSLRAFARKLEMQPAATNEILKGKRRVSYKLVDKIATKLQLDPTEKNNLLKNFPHKLVRKTKSAPEKNSQTLAEQKLSAQQFELISHWLHFAILTLMKAKDFVSDHLWIAERFNVSAKEVDHAIEKLLSLNLIIKTELGEYKRTSSAISTTDDVLSIALQQSYLTDMEVIKEKIKTVDVLDRDFSALTFLGHPKYLPEAKLIIRRAQDELEELMDQDDPQEVFKFCTYLFPLSQSEPQSQINKNNIKENL